MKTVSIQTFSAFAGAGLLGLVLVATGAMQVPGSVQRIPVQPVGEFHIAGIPEPREMLVIKEGTSFVVPAGKLLAVTGLGATRNNVDVTLRVDGQDEVATKVWLPFGNSTTIGELPPGFVALPGTTVDVVTVGGMYGCAWGYLVDQLPTPGLVSVAGIPDPRSMLVIREGTPFTVPAGRVLSITGIGGATMAVQTTLLVDEIAEFIFASNWSVGSASSVVEVPSGLTVHAGSSVVLTSGPGSSGRAWGYLADA